MRAKGMGAVVVITEIDPVKAIEAVMDGFTVMPMDEAAKVGDIFVTLTGCSDVITEKHFKVMKDGVLLANSGHFDVEINKNELESLAVRTWDRKPNIKGYEMADGRIINLLAEGRLVNLAAGNGHPAEIMDMSFAIQAKSLEFLAKNKGKLEKKLYSVPAETDRAVAELEPGETIEVHLEPEDAYGMPDPRMVITVEKATVQGSEGIETGDQVTLQDQLGRPFDALVTDVTDTHITFDCNHEMAGKSLNFAIELLEAV
jgi:adenosylhomocysteinase